MTNPVSGVRWTGLEAAQQLVLALCARLEQRQLTFDRMLDARVVRGLEVQQVEC
jgi:hypothetical protein